MTIVLGIVGASGSGKTFLAQKIKNFLGNDAFLVSGDAYFQDLSYLSVEERQSFNYDRIELIEKNAFLEDFQNMSTFRTNYDFVAGKWSGDTIKLEKEKYIIVEGLYYPQDVLDVKLKIDLNSIILPFCLKTLRDVKQRCRSLEYIENQLNYLLYKYITETYKAYIRWDRSRGMQSVRLCSPKLGRSKYKGHYSLHAQTLEPKFFAVSGMLSTILKDNISRSWVFDENFKDLERKSTAILDQVLASVYSSF